MKRQSHYSVYEVSSGDKQVQLNITIGFGQQALTKIYKDGKLIKTLKNSIKNLSLGKNSALQFARMEFKTAITNTQRNTNQMNCDFSLKGGVKILKYSDSYTATSPGELFIIDTKIDFL